jgi:hypothetical protein
VNVIDGTGALLTDRTVVLGAERIKAVAKANSIRLGPNTAIIPSQHRFLIPGLWDAHAHLSYFKASALPVLLANGVTSVRDMGGLLPELDRWRAEAIMGIRAGPRIYRAGPILNGKQFNEFQVSVANSGEARGAVRALHSAGVDFIKVHAAISREAYFGVQSECKALNLPFAGHMPRAILPEEASGAGQITIEHVQAFIDRFASEGVSADDMAKALVRFRMEKAPALFDVFAKNQTWFTPTLIATQSAIHLGDHQPDPRDRYVSASCKRITAELLTRPSYREFLTPDSAARQTRDFNELLPLVTLMRERGVGLLAGTDFAISIIYPGFSLHEELELLVAAGLTQMEALLAATAHPARVCGQMDLGTIQPGKLADLVLLDANPLTDIRNTRQIRAVVSRGKVYDRIALNQMLSRAEGEAQNT